ncbi:MAG TPA: pilus assembly PilX N-terminal domain-containing protein, partial [Pyrinomonadaceae bacterium]|nr:pilus assembly PilX N-terminal domain-containing protein [Pyrinomonadaceae bacterium]
MRTTNNHHERGAALLTVLMMSTLLLAGGSTLLLVTTLSGRTAIDSTAEMQAYYAAEGGLQATLDVLRGNVSPRSGMPSGSRISFRNAITLNKSNLPSDTSTSPRLSGWLNYDYTPIGQSLPDRASLTSNYAPQNGMAFSVQLSDPDNTPSGEPSRLRVRVTGYGPKGALKKLELVVNTTSLDYDPVATIMLRSSDDGTPITFSTGNSAAK